MKFLILIALLVCMAFATVAAVGMQMKPYLYEQSFEGVDPVDSQPWAVGSNYTQNFRGITSERAHSGKNSYKVDVTINDGGYLYFSIPLTLPLEGKMKFSAYMFIPEENTGKAATGVNYVFPPTPNSGCTPLNGETFSTTNGQWKQVTGDIYAEGRKSARVLTQYVYGITPDDLDAEMLPVGIIVDRIGIYLMGNKDQRVVMYLDDIKIEGSAPEISEYNREINSRWNNIRKKNNKKYAQWGDALSNITRQLEGFTPTAETSELMTEMNDYLQSAQQRYESVKDSAVLMLVDQSFIDASIKSLQRMAIAIDQISKGVVQFQDIRVTIVPPISDIKILPDEKFVGGSVADSIYLEACPGQIVPASFVVRALKNLDKLIVSRSRLAFGKHSIPAGNVDIKLVKCWYQAGSAWSNIGQDKMHRVFVPELLLNDDALVKVDHETSNNLLRLNFFDRQEYVNISDASKSVAEMVSFKPQEYPVNDSAELLPVGLNALANQQYWLTIKVPEKAASGIYSGDVEIKDGDRVLGTIRLKVKVLPFELDKPYYSSSIYYRGVLDKDWTDGSIGSEYKSIQQLRSELKNLVDHGVDQPTVYQSVNDRELLDSYMRIFREVGCDPTELYLLGTTVGGFPFETAEGLDKLYNSVQDDVKYFSKHGVKELYIYGIDEATGEVLVSQRKAFDRTHKAGAKVFVAGYTGTFDAVGDLLDLLVFAGVPSATEAAKWHSIDHKIWSYANPQGGVENPLVYRRNFGLLLWQQNFDGACTYAYQHAFGNIWNDFDNVTYRDHNFTYPTTTGVIDTIAWEGYREGVNDVRFLTTLQNAIKKVKGNPPALKSAKEFLKNLDIINGDLDKIRAEMIQHIAAVKRLGG